MKKEVKPFSWKVKNFCFNKQVIEDYDILKYREADIKKMKKKCNTKEEFAEVLKREMMYRFWAKCEWELIIEITEDDRIWLNPWVGCREPEKARIDVTDREDYDWRGFAYAYIDMSYRNTKKIDVWDQLYYVWQDFVDYCWNYRHKWQRKKKELNV